MSQALRAGLVGCGSLSQRGILPHLSEPDAREKVRLVAVADAVAERAHENAARFGVPSHFSGVEAMLAGVELDLVIVATPVQRHFADALAAVEAGKHVYVQKAMTSTLDQANELLAARDRAGVKLSAAPGYELCTTTEAVRRVVDDGVIGHVYAAFTYTFGIMLGRSPQPGQRDPLAEIDPTWNFQPTGGGPLPSITVYSLQLATSLLGPVRRVTALANHHLEERRWAGKAIPFEIADNTIVLMEFASGALGTAIGSAGRPARSGRDSKRRPPLPPVPVAVASYCLARCAPGPAPILPARRVADQPRRRRMRMRRATQRPGRRAPEPPGPPGPDPVPEPPQPKPPRRPGPEPVPGQAR